MIWGVLNEITRRPGFFAVGDVVVLDRPEGHKHFRLVGDY